MNLPHLLLFAISSGLGPAPAKADLAADIRTEWSIDPTYSDVQINQVAFSQSLYGIIWADWVVVGLGVDEIAEHILDRKYDQASLGISEFASEAAIEEAIGEAAGFSQITNYLLFMAKIVHNLGVYNIEINALKIQHDRYFQARPFNSFATILTLEPFELLDGVNMTKEGNGWLFTSSGYLSPLPSGNHMQPDDFYALAEAAWLSANPDPLELIQEQQLLCDLFTANLAVGLAQDSVSVAPQTPTSASVAWNCAPGTSFFIEHSTDLDGWTRTGPHTSTGNSIQVLLTSLPHSGSRFFRIVVEP